MKYFPLILSLILLPQLVLADTVIINNSVSAESNTGGNSASAGQVVEGESRSEVKVYTEVNGEVVEDFHEVKIAPAGQATKVEFESRNEVDSSITETKVESRVSEATAIQEVVSTTSTSSLAVETDAELETENKVWSFIIKYVFSFFRFF